MLHLEPTYGQRGVIDGFFFDPQCDSDWEYQRILPNSFLTSNKMSVTKNFKKTLICDWVFRNAVQTVMVYIFTLIQANIYVVV